MTGSRLYALDMLRGCAALLVVAYHYTHRYFEIYGGRAPRFGLSSGFVGVDIFFVVSGFVIYMTLDRIRDAEGWLLRFGWSRFVRLFPAFWIAVILTTCIVELFGLPGREVLVADVIKNLTMIPRLLGGKFVDGVYWSLEVELLFYFWISILVLVAKHQMMFVAGWAVASVLISAVAGSFSGIGYVKVAFITNWFPYFAFGIGCYLIARQRISKVTFSILAVSFVANVLLHRTVGQGMLVLVGGAFVLVSSLKDCVVPKVSALVFFGTISYSLYLVHQNIGYVLINQLLAISLPIEGAIAIAFLASVVAATFLTFFVERPCMRALKNVRLPEFVVARISKDKIDA